MFLVLLGGYWDIAWHVEVGRDTFWSPPHLVLYSGLLTILGAGAAAFAGAWRRARPWPRASATIAGVGAVLAVASGPVDDAWHRLYGLDVTLISPPHLMLLAGTAIAAFGALTGFAWRVNRADPAGLKALWRASRPAAQPWLRGETGFYVAAGLLLALVVSVLGEYDFDVSRYAVVYHPVSLAGLSALVLVAAVRAGGRVGGATLAAAAYTGLRVLAHFELIALTGVRPQIPLLLVAAPVLDFVLWRLSVALSVDAPVGPPGPAGPPANVPARGRRRPAVQAPAALVATPGRRAWLAAPLAGAAYAAVLLLVQWPYTVANNRVVWGPDVLLPAALPALLAGAAGALLGWLLGATLRPLDRLTSSLLPARPAGTTDTPGRRVPSATGPLLAIGLAVGALLLFAVVPAAANQGAFPRLVSGVTARQTVVGTLDFDPVVPVAGQPLTVRLTITDPFLISSQTLIPFESVRAGDVITGNFRSGTQPGLYQATFTPRQSGRRWLSAYVLVEEVRSAASASFVVYTPAAAVGQAPTGTRTVVLRPEPGPDPAAPPWLQPVAFVALGGMLLGAFACVAAALRAAPGESVTGAVA